MIAAGIVAACKQASDKTSCYEKEIPTTIASPASLSLEEAFAVTQLVQKQDRGYPYCHSLAHKLTAMEEKRFPQSWKSIMTRCPLSACNYGCLHGALLAHFRKETFNSSDINQALRDLVDFCEPRDDWQPTRLDVSMCYHAIGHVMMFLASGKPAVALDLCQAVGTTKTEPNKYEICAEGVFMTLLYPNAADIPIKMSPPTKENVAAYCRQFGQKEQDVCLRESASLFEKDLVTAPAILSFCKKMHQKASVEKCLGTVFNRTTDAAYQRANPIDAIAGLCKTFPVPFSGSCFGLSAQRIIQTDLSFVSDAVALCSRAGDDARPACFQALIAYKPFLFPRQAPQAISFCRALPPPWEDECRQSNSSN